mmetsp:Transcript_13633/g.30993  ORF Transcript_13633/g.30993 Transcript_13633/m.30993 type:complete len:200 (+) Transcript_13633:855-1454(+)
MVWRDMCDQLNSPKAFTFACLPIQAACWKFMQICLQPHAMLPGLGSTRKPSLSAFTKSRGPPQVVATTGFPAAQASSTTMPKGSFLLGTITASQVLNSAFKCAEPLLTEPAKCTAWPIPNWFTLLTSCAFMCPSPTIKNLASPRSLKMSGMASIKRSGPFCTASRPTKRNIGSIGLKPLSRLVFPDHSSCHSMLAIPCA